MEGISGDAEESSREMQRKTERMLRDVGRMAVDTKGISQGMRREMEGIMKNM